MYYDIILYNLRVVQKINSKFFCPSPPPIQGNRGDASRDQNPRSVRPQRGRRPVLERTAAVIETDTRYTPFADR